MAPSRPRSLRALAFGSTKRNSSPGPPSPTFSDTTNVSAMNFGPDGPEKIITRANLRGSLRAYEELMTTSANYRAALMTMSKVTAAFADAMENCSGLKGPSYEAGTRLQAASGLHHLIGNHWHVLAETIDKNFEKPLRQHLETYRTIVTDRSASYERALREKSQVIRDTEMRSMNRRERNLQSFREALAILQRQVDELDDLKLSHYREIVEHEEEVWEVVQGKVCVVVRSTMDVFDRFTAKASDPIIEPMLQSVPDPFDSYGPPQAEDQIFSILAPLSIMTSVHSSSPSPLTGTPERDTIEPLSSGDRITSWLPNANNGGILSSESTEWAGVPSSSFTTRPISPPLVPNRRHSTPPSAAGPRKSESKLRTVLSVIDEGRARHDTEETTHPAPPISSNQNETTPPPPQLLDTGPKLSWSFVYGQSPYDHENDDPATPRNATRFFPQSPIPLDPKLEPPKEPDDQIQTPLATY